MCDRRVRDLKRDLSTLADGFGARVEITQTKRGHFRARFTAPAEAVDVIRQTADVIIAGTPSDWRSRHNVRALVRRILRGA
jgi:hypothetical protein